MTNDIISISSAIQAAADYAGFSTEDIRCTEKHYANGLFEIGFDTDWSRYDCFVDAATGEVLGFNRHCPGGHLQQRVGAVAAVHPQILPGGASSH